jgi:hypothetical protein
MGRRKTEAHTVEAFEHRMELLAQAEIHGTGGRWIVTPRKGVRFLGPQERQRSRARERRRKVFMAMLEAIGLTLLIGLVPPLRVIWYVSAGLGVLLLVYVWLLLSIKARAAHPHDRVEAAGVPARPRPNAAPRYVAERPNATARPTFNGLEAIGQHDRVHVVVRPATSAAPVGA